MLIFHVITENIERCVFRGKLLVFMCSHIVSSKCIYYTPPHFFSTSTFSCKLELKARHSMSISDKSSLQLNSRRTHHSLSLPRNPIITHAIETDEQMIKFNQYVLQVSWFFLLNFAKRRFF